MAIKSLPATEVKNRFGRVLREVSKSGGPIIVERDGKPVAVIVSVSEYERMQERPLALVENDILLQGAFGLWSKREDIDDNWLAEGRARWESTWQND